MLKSLVLETDLIQV